MNPLPGESLLLLLPQMKWHLREEKEAHAPAEIVTVEGTGWVHFVTSQGLPGHLAAAAYCGYPVSALSRAPPRTSYGPASCARDGPVSIRRELQENTSKKSFPRVSF